MPAEISLGLLLPCTPSPVVPQPQRAVPGQGRAKVAEAVSITPLPI